MEFFKGFNSESTFNLWDSCHHKQMTTTLFFLQPSILFAMKFMTTKSPPRLKEKTHLMFFFAFMINKSPPRFFLNKKTHLQFKMDGCKNLPTKSNKIQQNPTKSHKIPQNGCITQDSSPKQNP